MNKIGETGIEIYMGPPRSGKTTMSALLARDYLRKGYTVYSNYPITGCRKLNVNDLMKFNIENALVIMDEAGLDFDSRDFTKFKKEWVEFFKLHGHYKLRIAIFTQYWDDVDKKIRTITNYICCLRRTIIPYCSF
jgi:hypothetical protein